jgi:phosphate/sulfate permease
MLTMHCLSLLWSVLFRLNVPRSSTLATVGAIAGVGVWEGRSGFNALLFVKMVSGWILTIIAAVSLTCEYCVRCLGLCNMSTLGMCDSTRERV